MSSTQPFELTITFTGLFLFVPHAGDLYALLPTTSGSIKHFACLSDRVNTCAVEFKDRGDLRIDGLANNSGFTTPPDTAFDLSRITNAGIPKHQIENRPSRGVFLRLKLPPATKKLAGGKKSEWKIPGISPNPKLSHQMVWTRSGITLPSIKVTRLSFETGTVEQYFEFHPQGNRLSLHFNHVPSGSECPSFGFAASHFAHYFHLYDPHKPGNIPELNQHPDEPCRRMIKPVARFDQADRRSASTFTCMTAQVPVG